MKKDTIILFDLDGTLIDSTDAITSTFLHAFAKHTFEFNGTIEDIKKQIGFPLEIMFENLGVPKEIVWDFVDSYKLRYRDISIEQTFLLENAYEAVKLASSFAQVSVVTTKTRLYTMPILENLELAKYFEIVTGRECVENPKPHPEPILKTLAQMNFNKNIQKAWMIGDTKLDLIAANEANIFSIGVLCGYSNEEELKKHTDIVKINSLEAVKYIQNLI